MTKEEAIKAMLIDHKKVRHRTFLQSEFIWMPAKTIIEDESGYRVADVIFWKYRKSTTFNVGWEIVNEEE